MQQVCTWRVTGGVQGVEVRLWVGWRHLHLDQSSPRYWRFVPGQYEFAFDLGETCRLSGNTTSFLQEGVLFSHCDAGGKGGK